MALRKLTALDGPIPATVLAVALLVGHARADEPATTLEHVFQADKAPEEEPSEIDRAITNFNARQFEEALTELNKILVQHPTNQKALYYRCRVHYELLRLTEALKDIEVLILLGPRNGHYYSIRGVVHRTLGDEEAAISDFSEALRLDPQDAYSYSERGKAQFKLGNSKEAVEDLSKALELAPDDDEARQERSLANVAAEDFDAALSDANRLVERNPGRAGTHRHRGYVYQVLKRHQEAIVDFTEAILLDPADAYSYRERAEAYRELEQFREAIVDFTEAIRLDLTDAYSYRERAEAHRELEQFREAVADSTKAIELDAEDDSARWCRGSALRDLGLYDAALDDANYLVQHSPDDSSQVQLRGSIYLKQGLFEQALCDYREAIRLDPQQTYPYQASAGILVMLGQSQEAIATLTKAIEVAPADAEGYSDRAHAYCTLGNWEAALADLTQSVRLDPEAADVLVQRAAVSMLCGDTGLAPADFSAAAELVSPSTIDKWHDEQFAATSEAKGEITDAPPDPENVLAEFIVPTITQGLMVPVRIGERSFRFMLDTGASSTILDRSLVGLLGPRRSSRDLRTGAGSVRVPYHDPITLSLDGVGTITADGPTGCADLSEMGPGMGIGRLDGVLGMDVISQLLVRIDLARHKIYFLRSCGDDAGVAIPFSGESGQKMLPGDPTATWRTPRVLLTLPETEAKPFLFDTGMLSGSVAINSEQYAKLLEKNAVVPTRATLFGTMDGAHLLRSGTVTSIGWGDFHHRHLDAEEHPSGNVIGLRYLSRYVVTLDVKNRRLLIKPSSLFATSQAELALRMGEDWIQRIGGYSQTEADEKLNEMARDNPTSAYGHRSRAMMLAEQDRLNEAIDEFTAGIGVEPANPELFLYRGTAYAMQERYELALADLTQTIALDSTWAEAFVRRGMVWTNKGKLTQAIQDFSTALRLDPDSDDAREMHDQVLAEQRRIAARTTTPCAHSRRGLLARWRARRCGSANWRQRCGTK